MHDNDLAHLTLRLKSLQHDMLQPETGQHMEYADNVTQSSNEQNNCYHYMHIWLVVSSMVIVLHKANFSLQQRNKFYLTIMVVVNIEKVPPTQSQLNIINYPTI